jgi:uncharacterized protein (DUF2141 family)
MVMIQILFLSLVSFASAFELKLELQDLKTTKGHFRYLVFSSSEGFPDRPDKAVLKGEFPASQSSHTIKDLSVGTYAISVIHDVNDNRKLDTGWFGIPSEPLGFSQNPSISFGAPEFKECKFSIKANESLVIRLKHF